MGRIDDLADRYYRHIATPWQLNLAGDQKTIFIVYSRADERRLRARLALFETETMRAKHKWKQFDCTKLFAEWMAGDEYRNLYFDDPEDLTMKLHSDFHSYAVNNLRQALAAEDVDEDTVVAVYGVASLYGFTKVSLVVNEVVGEIKGRMVLFFPGEFENNNYRLLDARDGWNYLAIPITLHNEGG